MKLVKDSVIEIGGMLALALATALMLTGVGHIVECQARPTHAVSAREIFP